MSPDSDPDTARFGPSRTGYEAARSAVAFHLLPRDVLRISGADAATYLQGQCSQDVSSLQVGSSADALLLSPQGKIDALIRISCTESEMFVLDTDPGFGAIARARIERFRLRVKVDIDDLDWSCVAVRGPDALSAVVGSPALVLPVTWPGFGGLDLLGPLPALGISSWIAEGATECDDQAWEALRIEAGQPVNGREVTEASIAAEVGVVDRTVSFTKGCFTGQELVARLDARGSNVARRLMGVVVTGGATGIGTEGGTDLSDRESALIGASVFTSDGEHEVGRLSSVAWSPMLGATVALATLHRRVVPPQEVLVSWDVEGINHHVVAEARPLPLST